MFSLTPSGLTTRIVYENPRVNNNFVRERLNFEQSLARDPATLQPTPYYSVCKVFFSSHYLATVKTSRINLRESKMYFSVLL